jgi:hypothetical protein
MCKTIRYMVDPQTYRWQYLLFRGLTIAGILCIFLVAKDGGRFFDNFKIIGMSGVIVACGLEGAFTGFIWSITLTTAANMQGLYASIFFEGDLAESGVRSLAGGEGVEVHGHQVLLIDNAQFLFQDLDRSGKSSLQSDCQISPRTPCPENASRFLLYWTFGLRQTPENAG